MTTVLKNADYWTNLNKGHRAVMSVCKEIAQQYDVLITTKNRESTSYAFTFLPNHKESTEALAHIKDYIKGTAFRVKLQGRAGVNGTKYRGCCNSVSFVPLSEASRMDVYVYTK